MSDIDLRLASQHLKNLVKVVKEVYTIDKKVLPIKVSTGVINVGNSINIYYSENTSYDTTLLSWAYAPYPTCCGYCIISRLAYKKLSVAKARTLAKAYKEYLIAKFGDQKGYSALWHAVSEQEKGYQKPFLKVVGFKETDSIISKGTNHKLTMMTMDIRNISSKRTCEKEYKLRYGKTSPYTLSTAH